ncbi:MAG: hypothetical protein H7Z11_17645 [Verrucomicrobia bacterium]|nr:hypothetical protein [Leptolyngbya sp. ES-bin-22]
MFSPNLHDFDRWIRLTTRETMLIRIVFLSLVLAVVTGCDRSSTSPPATNSTRSTSFNAPQTTIAPTAKAQRLEPGVTPAVRGFNDGYGDATVPDPRNPDRWLPELGFTAADQQIYRQEYNRGYDSVTPVSPTPTLTPIPTPTGSITPARRAELEQRGYQEGYEDAQAKQASNPERGIFILGLTDLTEKQIYTAAYNTGYRQTSRPPTITPERRSQLRQQGYQEGYAEAQANAPQDASRGAGFAGLVNAAEQQAYTNGYNSGYQASQQPLPNVLW